MRLSIITFLLVCLGAPAWAASPLDECANTRDIPVNVDPRFEPPGYDYRYSIAAIQGMVRESAQHGIQESLALGVTRYEPMMGISMPVKGITLPSGLVCAHVDKVDVTLGYRNVMVYIASELPQGSCGFREVMAHEQKHIDVNQRVLDEYKPIIEARIKEYVQANGVFREQTADYAMERLNRDLNGIISGLVGQMSEENQRRQELVDTQEEYTRITNSCNGEIASVSLHYLDRLRPN